MIKCESWLFTNLPDNASDELLLRVQKIQAMKRPSRRAQLTLFNLIRNTESLVADEAEFIRYSPDLAALVPDNEHGLFNNFLEDAFSFFSQRLTKVTLSYHAYSSLRVIAIAFATFYRVVHRRKLPFLICAIVE